MNGNPEAASVIKCLRSYPYFIQTHPLLGWRSIGLFKELNVEENKFIKVKTPEEFGNIKYDLTLAWYQLQKFIVWTLLDFFVFSSMPMTVGTVAATLWTSVLTLCQACFQ